MLRLLLVSGTMGLLIGLVLEFFTCSADMDADAAAADDDDDGGGDNGLAWTLERKLQSKSKPVERINHINTSKIYFCVCFLNRALMRDYAFGTFIFVIVQLYLWVLVMIKVLLYSGNRLFFYVCGRAA